MNTRKPVIRLKDEPHIARRASARLKPSRRWEAMIKIDCDYPNKECWENYLYTITVQRFEHGWPFGDGPYVRIGVASNDGEARHDWRELQRIKNDVVGPEWEAVELFPAESRLLDPSNYYLLWCAPKIPIGETIGRMIVSERNCVAPQRPWNSADAPAETASGLKLARMVFDNADAIRADIARQTAAVLAARNP
jgi:hypothetical protein